MSAPISPSLPGSSQISGNRKDELFAFDGVDALCQSWRDGLTPDASLQVSEWADRHRVLSPRASAEPGRYATSRTPYMRAIMDALSPSNPCRRVVFMKAAQVGAPRRATIGSAMSPPCTGADARGAADRRTRQAVLAPAHRSADRGESGAP